MTSATDSSTGEGTPRSVCAIVIAYRAGVDLIRCLDSICAQSRACDIVVVNNDPSDNSLDAAKVKFPTALFCQPEHNLGYAGGANLGASRSRAEILVFMNPDVRLSPGCIGALADNLNPEVGVAGPVMEIGKTGGREYGSTLNRLGMPFGLAAPQRKPLYVSGAVLATPRRVFERIGGFDERYFMFMEDAEYCWRVLLTGLDVVCVETAEAWHAGGAVAAGGYPMEGRPYATSELRLTHRERNTLAMFMVCAPWTWLPIIVPALLARTLGLALATLVLGHGRTALRLLQGIAWNIADLSTTLQRRRVLPRSRWGASTAHHRMTHRPVLMLALLRHWPPQIID